MKKVFFIIMVAMIAGTVSAESKEGIGKFLGKWDFTVANAPYEYRSGTVELGTHKKDKKLTVATINFEYDTVKDLAVSYDKGVAKLSFEDSGEKITVEMREKDGKYWAVASSPSIGNLEVTLSKAKE